MTNIKTKKTIIMHESLLESWLKDIVTFGSLFGMFLLNHQYTDGSGMIDCAITIFFFIALISKTSKTRKEMTLDETIKYLTNIKNGMTTKAASDRATEEA